MKGKWLRTILYLLLSLGALTMIFPFIWMLTTSVKSSLEVLSAQITLLPELKKYIRVGDELEQVEFRYALDLREEASRTEGRITNQILGKKYLESEFGRAVSNSFSRFGRGVDELFLRYRPPAAMAAGLDTLWAETVAPLLPRAARAGISTDLQSQLVNELGDLKEKLAEVSRTAVYSDERLAMVVLAGERRGENFEITRGELIWKRFLWNNFRKAWRAAPFARYFLNSIFMSVAVTIGQVLTSALAAYAFARMQFRFKEALFMILLGTMMVPKQVILIPDFVIISKLGWINTYYALIVPFVAAVFGIYFMRQHFETLPQDLFDAASIDGCGRFRTLFQIVLPLSRGVIITVSLFTFIMTWNSLLWPLVMTNTPEMRPLQVGLAVFNQESGTEWELLMAASTFSIMPLLLIFFIAQKQFIEGITRSGMKG